MKAILVIDEMPTSCYECQFQGMGGRDLELLTCSLNYWRVDNPNERPSWCPLKPLPTKITTATLSEREQEKTELFTSMALLKTYADGWNDCLKEIKGD